MIKKIRVLVVEDSLTVRKRMVAVLNSDPGIEVIGEAGDGRAAIELCREQRPDVVTLDIVLPVLSGVVATEYIMAHCPTPVLIVSSSSQRGELYQTYDALSAGALDVLEKPEGQEPEGAWEQELVKRVKLVSRIKVITHLRGRLRDPLRADSGSDAEVRKRAGTGEYRVVGIGASTGGPSAFVELLKGLPCDFALPILGVIHIADAFGGALAEWLDGHSPLPVSCAQDGDALPPVGQARVFLAPPGRHLMLSRGRVRLTDGADRYSCRPSVDVLFESLAREEGPRSVGCLLTGMGRDGARGLLAIRRAGGRTFAQDEASSVVFGMPQEAIRIGAAEKVLDVRELAPALTVLSREARGGRA